MDVDHGDGRSEDTLANFNTKLRQVVKLGGNAAIPLYDVTACA